MALSQGSLYTVRNWVGDEPSDAQLNADYEFAGSLRALVWGILRRRLTEFEIDPASFGAGGQYTQNAAANITALQGELIRLEGSPPDLGWDDEAGETTGFGAMATQRVRRVGFRR
jgi:hypothetical protein